MNDNSYSCEDGLMLSKQNTQHTSHHTIISEMKKRKKGWEKKWKQSEIESVQFTCSCSLNIYAEMKEMKLQVAHLQDAQDMYAMHKIVLFNDMQFQNFSLTSTNHICDGD